MRAIVGASVSLPATSIVAASIAVLLVGCGGPHVDPRPRAMAARAVPDIPIFDVEGTEQSLSERVGAPAVLHVFASWCAACRWELPALMRFETEEQIPVVALSMDPSFTRVRALFGGETPDNVFRVDEQDARRELGVSVLPQTLLVDGRGSMHVRFVGARDWGDDDMRDFVRRELGIQE